MSNLWLEMGVRAKNKRCGTSLRSVDQFFPSRKGAKNVFVVKFGVPDRMLELIADLELITDLELIAN